VSPMLCRLYAYVGQYFSDTIVAVDLVAGIIDRPAAATLSSGPGGASHNNDVVSLCGSGRHLYASERLSALAKLPGPRPWIWPCTLNPLCFRRASQRREATASPHTAGSSNVRQHLTW